MNEDLQALIKMAKTLSDRLEKSATDERNFCLNVRLELEQMSWEILRTSNDIKEISYYC